MRVVVDTNVLISGIFWRGTPGRVLDALAANQFTLCVSAPILDEYLEVIDRIAAKTGRPEVARPWRSQLLNLGDVTEITYHYDDCRDPDDAMFVECAVSAKALYIVSGDDDLLTLGTVENVEMVTAAAFLQRLSQ